MTVVTLRPGKTELEIEEKESPEEIALQRVSEKHFKQLASTDEPMAQKKHRIPPECASRYRIATLVVSWLTIGLMTLFAIISLVYTMKDDGSSSFAFTLDAALDSLSSAVIIVRFFKANSIYAARKECIACIFLGVLFLVSGGLVVTKATFALCNHAVPHVESSLRFFSLTSAVACVILAVLKTVFAYKLESISVATDAVNSYIGMIMSVSTLVSEEEHEKNEKLWILDPASGLACSSFLFIYGLWLIVTQMLKLKSLNDQGKYQELPD